MIMSWKDKIRMFGLWTFLGWLVRRIKVGHWSVFTDLIATSTSVTTGSYVTMTGSPYNPLKSGRLRKIILKAGGDAATSLIDGVVRVRLSCATFGGVYVFVAMSACGIRTAPVGMTIEASEIVDVPVVIGSTVTVEIYQNTGATPVTPRFEVYGVFEG